MRSRHAWISPALFLALLFCDFPLKAAERDPPPDFRQQIEPILVEYCYECHGLGEKKGEVAFDELKSDDQLLHNRDLWWKALRNVRRGHYASQGTSPS